MDAIKLLGSLMGNKSLASGLGSQLLGGLLGGGQQQQQAPASSGLAGILGGMMGGGGGQQQSAGSGLLGSVLGSVMGGGGSAASGIAGLVGGMLGGGDDAQEAPAPQQAELQQANDQAVLMIRAMVNAAKSDGRVDQTEQENIISKLGSDVSEAEINFLKQEFAAPLDVAGFARSVPNRT